MRIETNNLIIRAIQDNDSDDYYRLIFEKSLPGMQAFMLEHKEISQSVNIEYIKKHRECLFPIILEESNTFIGCIELQRVTQPIREFGINLLAQYQNKGFGPESIIAWGNWFHSTNGSNELLIRIAPDNMHSQHVFEKLGAQFQGKYGKTIEELFSRELCESGDVRQLAADLSDLQALHYILPLPIPG